jgi:hypothetical protein
MREQTRLLKYGCVDVTSEHGNIDRDVWEKSIKETNELEWWGMQDNRG